MAADRILVLGLMGRYPMAGVAWQVLHYVIGLERLGFEVYYVEDSGAPPYDPVGGGLATDATANLEFVRSVMRRTARPDNWVYWDILEDRHHGLDPETLADLYATSAQIWNLCGATRLRTEHGRGPRRVYVQTDPGFEQVALASGNAEATAALAAHDVFFTYGENLARATLPSGGLSWHPTRPPIVLDQWAAADPAPDARFSTVGSWQNRGKDVRWNRVGYRWSKDEAFLRFLEAPGRAGVHVEAALAPPADVARRMSACGWSLRDPHEVSADLDVYRRFLLGSCGEFTVAKDLYVKSRSGWFSDRSASYLAAGRAVVTQDTGFSDILPSGAGLLAYQTLDEATAALREVAADPARHGRAARVLAAEFFDATPVLTAMLETIA